jgi:hypothetical protein
VTKTTIATVSSVLTMVTLVSKRFKFVVTNVTPGSEAVTLCSPSAARPPRSRKRSIHSGGPS